MPEYINVNDAIKELAQEFPKNDDGTVKVNVLAYKEVVIENCIQRIKNIPPVDVVEVIRCKDCIFAKPIKDAIGFYICESGLGVGENHFCSYGDRGGD